MRWSGLLVVMAVRVLASSPRIPGSTKALPLLLLSH